MIEAAIPTINARHSSKYFGLKKGVVAYTLPANHVPLNARIIGANEHESHFVFDVLLNNATDILPAIHFAGTHGTNHVNFALLHLFSCAGPSPMPTAATTEHTPSTSRRSGTSVQGWLAMQWSTTTP